MSAAPAAVPPVLLPYQQRWLADRRPFKIGEKSRRAGLTWAEAADDVLAAASAREAGGQNVYYIAYNQDMTLEYILACAQWARAFDYAAGEIEESIWPDPGERDRDILTYSIHFPSGFRIVALSSRPTNLRGKQGVVVIDEAAFHDRLDELLKAALALLIWGGAVRVISTHNGAENAFNQLVNDARAGRLGETGVHRIEFRQAVADGLYRRVCARLGHAWSPEAEARFVEETYRRYRANAAEELDVIPASGEGAFLSGALIEARAGDAPVLRWRCADDFAARPDGWRQRECQEWIDARLAPCIARLNPRLTHYYGMDFGRSVHLSAIAPLALEPDLRRRCPFLIELRNVPFRQQQQILHYLVDRLPRFIKGAHDARGNGQQLAEEAWQKYGLARIEPVMLTEEWYRSNMPAFQAAFQDAAILIPRDADVREDLRAIRLVRGVARIPEGFEGKGADGKPRHADTAIALALAYYASQQPEAVYDYRPVPRRPDARERGVLERVGHFFSRHGFRRGGL